MKRLFATIFLSAIFIIFSFPKAALAQKTTFTCVVYFTGIGCSHCAKTDPVLFTDLLQKYPDLIIVEYEIYQQRENAPLLYEYDEAYGSGLGIPLIIFDKETHAGGDTPILRNIEEFLEVQRGNSCPLVDGSSIAFNELDLSSLPGKPKIWAKERVLISSEEETDDTLLKGLLTAEDISQVLEGKEFETVDPQPVALSGRNVAFENAVKINGWIFEWDFAQEEGGIPWNIVVVVGLIAIVSVGILWKAKLT